MSRRRTPPPVPPTEEIDPLAATEDQRLMTSLEAEAEIIARTIDAAMLLSPRDRAILEALSLELAYRVAEVDARRQAASEGYPRRIRELERQVAEHEAKWRRHTGEADTNGRFGRLVDEVKQIRADVGTPDERRAERAEVKQLRADMGSTKEREDEKKIVGGVRHARKKMLAGILALGMTIAGGLRFLKSSYDAAVAADAVGKAWRSTVDRDLDRLFLYFNVDRKDPTP